MTFLSTIKSYIKKSEYFVHKTKRSILIRFLLLVFVFIAYFVFISLKHGLDNGLAVTILTWSFFVLCTPIADAGFLLDFPIRLITKIRMIYSEIVIWGIAFLINIYSLKFNPLIYEKIEILRFFKQILLHPFPFWAIIIISAIGTFMSVYFGDEMVDVVKHKERKKYKKHKNKYLLILILFMIVVIILLYVYLLKKLKLGILI
jgi:hypothetical protein